MKVIIVGCGRMGAELAYRLFMRKHDVAVIDFDEKAFHQLSPDFHGRLYEGDGLSQDVLHRAGIEECDAMAVVTNNDETNLVVGHVARNFYKVTNVVARNYNPLYRALFEVFHLQTVSATGWAAQRLEEMLYHSEVRTVFSAGNGEVEIYEVTVPAFCEGRKIRELIGPESIAVAISRAGRALLPTIDTLVVAGDVLHVSATLEGIDAVRAGLCIPPKEG